MVKYCFREANKCTNGLTRIGASLYSRICDFWRASGWCCFTVIYIITLWICSMIGFVLTHLWCLFNGSSVAQKKEEEALFFQTLASSIGVTWQLNFMTSRARILKPFLFCPLIIFFSQSKLCLMVRASWTWGGSWMRQLGLSFNIKLGNRWKTLF